VADVDVAVKSPATNTEFEEAFIDKVAGP
jgi:hypothetical protein